MVAVGSATATIGWKIAHLSRHVVDALYFIARLQRADRVGGVQERPPVVVALPTTAGG